MLKIGEVEMAMIEVIDCDSVKKAGFKVLDLADHEGWSGALLYIVLRELGEFLESQGVRSIESEVGDISEN